MNYSEAIEFLYELRLFGAKYGLENTFRLAAQAGNPHHHLRFIHVAGTNGKGSTCAMLESIYRRSGLRVGLFTSPHLVAFGERIQVNRQPINESQVVQLVQTMKGFLAAGYWRTANVHPTFFEVVTIMALSYFAEQECDLVIWETGLGGRLDATNIVTPLASVITNIQFDHQQWLGNTLAQIAAEKAGIIKPQVPVLTATDAPEALEVIRQVARERHAPLTVVGHAAASEPLMNSLRLPLLGEHQKLNASLALATVEALQPILPVPITAIRSGLEQVEWAGRLQIERTPTGQMVVLDGAHNPAGADALRAALAHHFPQARPTLILGILRDKDWQTMCRTLAPLTAKIYVVPVHTERTAKPEELQAACLGANPDAGVTLCANLSDALHRSRHDPFIVLAGSLYLVGEAMELLHLAPGETAGERGLNEWAVKPLLTREC